MSVRRSSRRIACRLSAHILLAVWRARSDAVRGDPRFTMSSESESSRAISCSGTAIRCSWSAGTRCKTDACRMSRSPRSGQAESERPRRLHLRRRARPLSGYDSRRFFEHLQQHDGTYRLDEVQREARLAASARGRRACRTRSRRSAARRRSSGSARSASASAKPFESGRPMSHRMTSGRSCVAASNPSMAVVSDAHAVSRELEQPGQRFGGVTVVLDDQNAQRTSRRERGKLRPRRRPAFQRLDASFE